MKFSVFLLSLWLQVLQLESVTGQSACPDEYSYTFQPPQDAVCNPYINGLLSLDCAAVGPGITGILWYFSNMSIMNIYSEETVLLAANSSKYTLTPVPIVNGKRVILTVSDLNEDDDMGSYWCRATLTDGQLLSMSGFFELQSRDMYQKSFSCFTNALKNSDIRCASIFNPELTDSPSISPSTMPPSTFHTPSPTPSITDETTATTLFKTGTQTVPTDQPSFVETSEFVLYAVLGLVGLLGVVCVVLVLVILLLCRRRCRRIGLEGSESKESAFEQLSNQSLALVTFKRNNHTPFQPDISMQIPGSRNTSGDYAEIGPVLMTLHSHNNSSPPLPMQPQTHNYSEIRQLIPHSDATLPPIPRSAGTGSVDPYHITGYENPYDVPVLPTEQQQQQQISQTAIVALPPVPTSPDSIESVDSHPVSRSHDYQILERMLPVRHEMSDTISESSSFSTPPLSPHNYHTLEDEQVSQDFSRPTTTSSVSHDFDHQSHDSVRLSCDSIEMSGTNRLPTIPEHPYNSSEEDIPTAFEEESPVKLEPSSTTTTTRTNAVNGSDIVTPSYTDPEISEGAAGSFAESSKDTEEQEYDRLIDPSHLYHILEHSSTASNRPRIRELANSSYSQLEPTKQRSASTSSTGRGQHLITHLHFHNPQIDRVTADSPTSDSSLDDDRTIFDDPQYQTSPLKRRNPPLIRSSSDSTSVPLSRPTKCTHGHPPRFLNIDKDVSECSGLELAKYRGDYERDPGYMLQLKKKASRSSPDSDVEGVSGYIRETGSSHDDSGFLTFSGSTSPVNYNTRRASMPDFPHVYQALETSTLNTLQPYERIRKN